MEARLLAYTIADTIHATGHDRTTTYELCVGSELDARAAGSRTLVTADSLKEYIERLSEAPIRPNVPSDAAAASLHPARDTIHGLNAWVALMQYRSTQKSG